MVFSYFTKLSAPAKRIYRRSDEIPSVPLPDAEKLRPYVERLAKALNEEDRAGAEELCRALASGMATRLRVPPIRLNVLAVRPSASWGELHGLYELSGGRASAVISLWMRTAKHRRVVAFRAFLRTFLHEFCHHLDYHLYNLPDSFHTEGFYKRESSLFHQLIPQQPQQAHDEFPD
ncbi:MAG TPA: hypothetical protein VK654_06125 [Nitrospirota bacterium]|nr:hypothetical protein [Nitrospirota bacterium]